MVPLKSLPLTIGVALLVLLLAVHWGGVTGEGRRLAVLAATAVFILLAAARAASPSLPLAGNRLLLIPAALILAAVLVALSSPIPAAGRLEWREIVSCALILAAFLLQRPPDSARLLFMLVLLPAAAGLVIYGVIRRGGVLFSGDLLTSTYLNRNHFAAFLGLVFPAALAFSLVSRPRPVVWLSRVVIPVLLAGILLTRSRGGLLAVLISGLAVLSIFILGRPLAAARRKKLMMLLLIAGLLIAAAIGVFVAREPAPEVYSTSLDALSIRTRVSIWRSTGDIFLSRPLSGWGWGTFRYLYPGFKDPGVWYVVPHAHNEFLQLLAEGGMVGFLIIILSFVWSFSHLVRAYRTAPRSVSGIFALGAAGALVYAAVHGVFDFILRLPANALLLTALVGLGLASSPVGSGISRRPVRLAVWLGLILIPGLVILRPVSRMYLSFRLTQRGERLLAAGDPAAAGELFSRAHRLDPPALPPLLGRAAAGMAVFDRTEDKVTLYRSIVEDLETARRNNPRDIQSLRSLSRFHRDLSAWEEASGYLKEALSLDPLNPYLHYELAEIDLERGDYLSAARRLRRACEIYPMMWGSARKLLFSHTGNYEILRELPPRRSLFHRRMGYQLLAGISEAGARKEFEQALELAPEDPENWRALGRFYSRTGKPDLAAPYYRRALALAPENHQWLAELGDILKELDQLEEARDYFLRARELEPGRRRYSEKAGATISVLEGPAAAIAFWREVSAGDPGWSRPYFLRARLLREAGRPEEAVREIDRALALDPDNRHYINLKTGLEANLSRKDAL